jgi:hypothetical protein
LRVAVYRSADGVLELFDRGTALGGVGESAKLELKPPSTLLYTLSGAHSGALSLTISDVSVARNVRAWIWVGESWAVPVQAL